MQAAFLIAVFLATAIVVQTIGFGISRIVNYQWPAAGLLTFLTLFLMAYGIAWPIAVRITEWLIVRAGYKLQEPDPRAR